MVPSHHATCVSHTFNFESSLLLAVQSHKRLSPRFLHAISFSFLSVWNEKRNYFTLEYTITFTFSFDGKIYRTEYIYRRMKFLKLLFVHCTRYLLLVKVTDMKYESITRNTFTKRPGLKLLQIMFRGFEL